MAPSIWKTAPTIWRRVGHLTRNESATRGPVWSVRFLLLAAVFAAVVIHASTRNVGLVSLVQSALDCPAAQTRINLVFIIDRSGSLANRVQAPSEQTRSHGRGQTYNVEIEGARCALRDPSVIPRDGSVSVGMVLFDGAALAALPLTSPISSDIEAQTIASQIETLRCPDSGLDSHIEPCPGGNTNFDAAIRLAEQIARSRSGARRVFIMSTDGEANDPDIGVSASTLARENARVDGVEAELDVILMGLGADELDENIRLANKIVFAFPQASSTAFPGAVVRIDKTDCNEPDKVSREGFDDECGCQVRQFADFTRRALRSNVASRDLIVNTLDDPNPNTPVPEGGPRSLRQAIETANLNGGRANITFQISGIIQPHTPLPALSAPDITICGCAADCASSIPEPLTCSQTLQVGENRCERMVTIDGQGKLADGILVRSNRDVVRGLRIINFSHAGIEIKPVCPSDNTGFNRVELNSLENNVTAGVCVLDPSGKGFAVTHNIGNTISMNDISGSETPIDLACDGRTSNDAGDLDDGPNTLLNFPEQFTAETSGNTVTVTSKVNIPVVECPITNQSVVEIFAVTEFHPESGVALIDAVTFFARIPIDDSSGGSFSMQFPNGDVLRPGLTGEAACSIDGYTATFTDRAGNTSELIPFCTGPPRPKVSPESIEFKRVDPSGERSKTPESKSFTIENCGCSRLNLSSISIERKGKDVRNRRIINPDDSESGSGFFSAKQINDSCEPQEIQIPGNDITIDPGKSQRFSIEFNPVIPGVVFAKDESSMGGLFAKHVLPADLASTLNLQQTGSGDFFKISLGGHVTTAVKLIDPVTTSNPPKVTLERSGDNLFVTFSVFDSNLDVNKVNYEFFKVRDGQCSTSEPVPAKIVDPDLGKAIRGRTPSLVTGQSFSVMQRFSGASDHPEAGCVRVTVSDGETSVSAPSSPTNGSQTSRSFKSRNLPQLRGATIVRPTLKLASSIGRSSAGISRRAARRLSRAHKHSDTRGVDIAKARSRSRLGGDQR